MTELTREDEALLAGARRGLAPTERDRERNQQRILARLSAGAAGAAVASTLSKSAAAAGKAATATSAASAAGGATTGALVLGVMKVVVVAAVVGSTAGMGMNAVDRAKHAELAKSQRVAAAATPIRHASPTASLTLRPSSPPPPPSPAPGPGPGTGPGPGPGTGTGPGTGVGSVVGVDLGAPSTVAAEAALLRHADDALTAGNATAAMTLLQRHADEFPAGVMVEEREAETVMVLCAMGKTAEARAARATFLQKRPRSPQAPRVRASCGGS